MTTAVLLLALLAPAPHVKPPVIPAVKPGDYMMLWSGVPCPSHFHADGFIAENYRGEWWHGRWSCKGGVLTVTEYPIDRPDFVITWTVKLKSSTEGTLHYGGTSLWKLEPLTPKRVD